MKYFSNFYNFLARTGQLAYMDSVGLVSTDKHGNQIWKQGVKIIRN